MLSPTSFCSCVDDRGVREVDPIMVAMTKMIVAMMIDTAVKMASIRLIALGFRVIGFRVKGFGFWFRV